MIREISKSIHQYEDHVAGFTILVILFIADSINFLLFHAVAELISVVIAGAVFIFTWNTRKFLTHRFLFLIGTSLAFVGGLDLIHTLVFPGMGFYPGDELNAAAQLWIAARLMLSITMVVGLYLQHQPIRFRTSIAIYTLITTLIILSIFQWKIFPAAYITGVGQTPFRFISGIATLGLFLGVAIILLKQRKQWDPEINNLLVLSIGLSIVTELMMFFIDQVESSQVILTHFAKVASYYLIYKALIATGFTRPFALLFHDLQQRELELRQSHNELAQVNLTLQKELEYQVLLENENRKTATESQQQAAEMEAIFDSLTDAVVVYNQQGFARRINHAALSFYGFDLTKCTPEEIFQQLELYTPGGERVPPENLPSRSALRGERVINQPFQYTNPQGRHFAVLASASPLYLNDEIIGAVVVWHDVTALEKSVRAQGDLLAANRRQRILLQKLVQEAPAGIAFLQGPEHRYTLVNAEYLRISRGKGSLVGFTVAETWPEIADEIIPLLNQVYQTGESYSTVDQKFMVMRESGYEENYFNFTLTPIFKEEDEVEGIMILVLETTEQVHNRKVVEEEQARLRAIIDNAPEGIALFDAAGNVLLTNPAAYKITGSARFDIPLSGQKYYPNTYYPDGSPILTEDLPAVQAITQGKTIRNMEILISTMDGTTRPVIAQAAPIQNRSGENTGAVVLFQDITERKQSELALLRSNQALEAANAALRESEARERAWATELETLMDAVPAAVWIAHDPQAAKITGNRAAYNLHRLPSDTNPSRTPAEGSPPMNFRFFQDGKEMETHELPVQKAAQSGIEIKDFEGEIHFDDGSVSHIYGNIHPLLDENNQPRGAIGAFVDISQMVLTKQALRESEARFRGLVESMDDFIFTLDTSSKFTGLYGHGIEKLGFAPFDAHGKTIPEVIGEEGTELHYAACDKVLAGGNVVYEWTLNIEGRTMNLQISMSPICNDQGNIIGIVGVGRDISNLKRVESALEDYTRQLQRSNQELQQFAFVASHDLQEPLRKIEAFGSRLTERLEGRLDTVESDFLARMIQAAQRMQKMINDLLAYSRITTKALPYEPVNLSEVIQDVLSDLEVRLDQTGGKVNVEELPVIEADPLQMRQLLQNLIGNALKFHKPDTSPEITISAKYQGQTGDAPKFVDLLVKDNGIGFDMRHIDRIFQPFERLNGRSEFEGTGMGLAICRKIVERHQGTITAESTRGEGTTFVITLPVRQS